jgi:hypothetical protein
MPSFTDDYSDEIISSKMLWLTYNTNAKINGV